MRPGQWPILTAQFFLAVMLVSPRASGGGCWYNPGAAAVLAGAWLAWVILLNGGTLAFNSSYDRDTGPVAYLPDPPPPPRWLAGTALTIMACGALLGWFLVGHAFGLVVGACVVLSVLYSLPGIRLKARPGLDLLTNMVGYGAGTTLAGLLAGTAAYLGNAPGTCGSLDKDLFAWPWFIPPAAQGTWNQQVTLALAGGKGWLVAGFGLLFGSFYPATQIYQVQEDLARGDRTLTTVLGIRRSLLLAAGLGLAAGVAFLLGWITTTGHWSVVLPAVAVIIWTVHHILWWKKAGELERAGHEKHMYTDLTLWAVTDAALLVGWFLRS